MDTWNIDRIYNWMGFAMGHIAPESQKFYFDFSDKTFFALLKKDDQYLIQNAKRLSDEDFVLLNSKIEKIKKNDSSVLQIPKSKRILKYLFDQTTSYENYMKREDEWNFVNEEMRAFFNKHSIYIEEARLIE